MNKKVLVFLWFPDITTFGYRKKLFDVKKMYYGIHILTGKNYCIGVHDV